MKTRRSLLGPAAVYLGTAMAFLALDLYGLSFAQWDWAPISAVFGQILGLTLVVGTWISAMIFFEKEGDELTRTSGVPRSRAAASPQERTAHPAAAVTST